MADIQMPGYLDYGKMYEMDPAAGYQALQQATLAQQFAQQQRQEQARQAEADLQRVSLDNQFNLQNMPTKLRQSQLTADTTEAQLGPLQTKSRIDALTAPQQLQEKFNEYASKQSEHELKQFDIQTQTMINSSDPEIRKKGLQRQVLQRDFVKSKYDEQLRTQGRLQEIGAQTAGQKQLEQMRIDAGKYKKTANAVNSITAMISSGKLSYEKAATMLLGQSMFTEDPQEAEALRQKAAEFEEMNLRQKTAGVQGKADIEAMTQGQIPTQKVSPVLQRGSTGPSVQEMRDALRK